MKDGVVQSGSVSVIEDVPGNPGNTDKGTKSPEKEPATQTEEKVLAGKFKSAEDLEKGYTELEKKLTTQGTELGSLRKQNEDLMSYLKQVQPRQEPQSTVNDVLNQTIGEISKLDFVEDDQASQKLVSYLGRALQATAQMSQENALKAATDQFQKVLNERDTNAIQNEFLKDNPDFAVMKQNGVFQALKEKNPMHDDFSAYYEAKASDLSQKISELQTQLDEAKKVANLANGDEAAGKVFTKPGASVRTDAPIPKNHADLMAGALAAVQAAAGR